MRQPASRSATRWRTALGAAAVLVLIGERPGLSAPDSLGAYLTWAPDPATTDAARNCVSNIRQAGVPPARAARTIAWLLERMRERRLSGVAIKDDTPVSGLDTATPPALRDQSMVSGQT